MTINCPKCGRELLVDAGLRGHMLGCPYCQARFAAPIEEYKTETRGMTRSERLEDFANRMGMTLDEIMGRMGRELFYTQHPKTGKWMLCWALTAEEGAFLTREHYKRNRRFTDFILDGPQTKSEWFVWWLLLPLVPLALIMEGSRKVCGAIDAAATREAYKEVYYGGGGDGIFDHVNSVRKSDIEFLFGGLKGK